MLARVFIQIFSCLGEAKKGLGENRVSEISNLN